MVEGPLRRAWGIAGFTVVLVGMESIAAQPEREVAATRVYERIAPIAPAIQ